MTKFKTFLCQNYINGDQPERLIPTVGVVSGNTTYSRRSRPKEVEHSRHILSLCHVPYNYEKRYTYLLAFVNV